MTKNIFIGVDGGGSKCKVVVENEHGIRIGEALGGATLIKCSVEKSWATILNTTKKALQNSEISLESSDYDFHIGLGLTGCEIPSACEQCLDLAPPYFKTVKLKSDSYTACLGAHNGNDGSIIIIGTGTVAVQIKNGEAIQIGGWGFPHSDEGSGAWLGMEATRETFKWLDGRRIQSTPLLETIFAKFDNDLTKLVVYANAANSTKFAELAPLVIDFLQNKDPTALDLITKAAKEIDLVNQAMQNHEKIDKNLPCALLGGIAPFLKPYLCDNLKKRIIEPKHDAAYGAVLMLKKYNINE